MIHLVNSQNMGMYSEYMEQAYRLRHKIFVEEKGWSALRRADSREIDEFDDEHAVHMLFIEQGRVLGYQRMLPTVRPYLLTSVLPQLCETTPPCSEAIWEWTRYCVVSAHRERGRILSPVANALLSGIVDWGLKNGVNGIVIEMNPLWLLRLVQLHFRVTPLGLPQPVEGEDTVAVVARFDRRTLDRLHAMSGAGALQAA